MRAGAIFFVLVSHLPMFFQDYNNVITDSLQVLGLYGVEIFFVLSGFLIGDILLKMLSDYQFTFKSVLLFWVRRWFRTLPLYFLVLSVNVILFYIINGSLPIHLWKYVFFLQNFKDEYLIFFPESWSLSVEEYTYLLAPLGLFFFIKLGKHFNIAKTRLFLYNTCTLCAVFLITKTQYYFNNVEYLQSFKSWNINLKSMVIYRIDAILFGFVLIYFFRTYFSFFKTHRLKFFITGSVLLAFLIISILVFPIGESNTFYWNVLFLPLSSIAIACILPFLYFFKLKHLGLSKWIEKISLYSYSMYLLHYSLTFLIIERFLDFTSLEFHSRIICSLLYLIVVFWLSKLSYSYFEKPVTDLRDSKIIKKFFRQ